MLRHLAVGDSLGKICSKYSKNEVIEIYGKTIDTLCAAKRRGSDRIWEEGDVTDDTILTLIVADSLLENGGFVRSDIGSRFISCDPKGGTQIKKLKESKDPNYVAVGGITNGASIRNLALSVFYEGTNLVDVILQTSTLTHASDEAVTGAIIVSFAQHYAFIAGETCSSEDLISILQSKYLPEFIYKTKTWCNLMSALSIGKYCKRPEDLADDLEEKIGYSKLSECSVPTSVALGLFTINNYEQLIRIIHRNHSDCDLDTVASISGSIMGAIRNDDRVKEMSYVIEIKNNLNFRKYANELNELRLRL